MSIQVIDHVRQDKDPRESVRHGQVRHEIHGILPVTVFAENQENGDSVYKDDQQS
jgi:hypothetical protein